MLSSIILFLTAVTKPVKSGAILLCLESSIIMFRAAVTKPAKPAKSGAVLSYNTAVL